MIPVIVITRHNNRDPELDRDSLNIIWHIDKKGQIARHDDFPHRLFIVTPLK